MKSSLLALALLAGSLMLGFPGSLQAETCSNGSLRGSFGLRATGRTVAGGDLIVLGRFNFDGNGNLSAVLFIRRPDATNATDTITGTYSVSPRCIVTDVWHSITGGDSTHTSVLTDRGNAYFILNTTEGSGIIISGDARKVFPKRDDD